MCVVVILTSLPGGVTLGDALHLAGAAGKLQTLDFSFDLTERYTVWSGLFAALFLFLSYFGCDQSQVQRYLTARSVDEGRTSLMMSAFLKIPLQFLILLIGVLVFVFYQFHPAPPVFNAVEAEQAARAQPAAYERLETEITDLHSRRQDAALQYLAAREVGDAESARVTYIATNDAYLDKRVEATAFIREANRDPSFNDVNYVFPTFVLTNMPVGLVGLIIAAILAAAMSSVAAELNSLATASTMDFYRRHFRREGDDAGLVRFGRVATLIWGIFACIVATFATNLGSLIEVVNTFGSFFYGSLLGVFVLAFAVPGAKPAGAFYGLLFGIVSVWIASAFTDIAFLWFNVVGCLVTVAAGLLISRLVTRTAT
jgi:Na+/proline symporter